ncbi:MAG: hypothetical protein ACRDWH_00955 [Acidimicrobiia bacterium]
MPAAAADCERILESWWGQPVNTATAFGFVGAGLLIWLDRRDLATAGLVALVGVGSIAFHGPMPPGAEAIHDLSIAWILIWVLLTEMGQRRWWPFGLLVGAGLSITPTIANPVQAILTVIVIGVVASRRQTRAARVSAMCVLGVGALVGTLSRTGGPWCLPQSIWQGHGLWHLAAAAAVTIWAVRVQGR